MNNAELCKFNIPIFSMSDVIRQCLPALFSELSWTPARNQCDKKVSPEASSDLRSAQYHVCSEQDVLDFRLCAIFAAASCAYWTAFEH